MPSGGVPIPSGGLPVGMSGGLLPCPVGGVPSGLAGGSASAHTLTVSKAMAINKAKIRFFIVAYLL